MPQNQTLDPDNKLSKLSNVLLVLVIVGMLVCRAGFHSNYDLYSNIQSFPAFYDQEISKQERNEIKLSKLHEYLRSFRDNIQNQAKPFLSSEHTLEGSYSANHDFKRDRYFFFLTYFIIDFFFMFLLSRYLYQTIQKRFIISKRDQDEKPSAWWVFIIFCTMSVGLDIAENTIMLIGSGTKFWYNTVSLIKTIVIGLTLLIWFFHFYFLKIKPKIKALLKALAASSLSIIVMIIILILLTQMDQGTTLVIALFTDPANSAFFIFLILFTALLISHYPTYLFIRFYENDRYQWIWSTKLLFPVIYYNRTKDYKGKERRDNNISTIFRHSIGSIFLLIILYTFVFSWNKTSSQFPVAIINQLFLLLGFFIVKIHIYLNSSYQRIRADNPKPICSEDESNYRYGFGFYLIFILTTLILFSMRFSLEEWNLINKIATSFQLLIIIFLFTFFREFRGLLKYRFGLSPFFLNKETDYDIYSGYIGCGQSLLKTLINKKLSNVNISNSFKALLGNFSNSIYYLSMISIFGVLVSIIIISTALKGGVQSINGANYLLFFIMFYYALIILILKISFYGGNINQRNLKVKYNYFQRFYNSNYNNSIVTNIKPKEILFEKDISSKFLSFIPVKYTGFVAVMFIVASFISFKIGNDLHLLNPIPINGLTETEKPDFIEKEEFINRFNENSNSETIFALSAFGGGLKANYNTLKTLQAIDGKVGNKFFDNTISMSGVSGGGLGLANYYLMKFYKAKGQKEIFSNINAIGKLDIVAIDIPYLLFNDALRSSIPKIEGLWNRIKKNGWNYDRSNVAMREYRNIILEEAEWNDFDKMSFHSIHKKIYARNLHAPVLLMNTTSTELKYGIASSVHLGDFPGAINILKTPTKDYGRFETINFYDAVSTINRFPLLSPAAKIKNTGHFVDGGYFENSGILSTISFLDKISGNKWSPDKKIDLGAGPKKLVIINFLNGKSHWINHLLQSNNIKESELRIREKDASEISSVINTVTGTEMLPNFFVESLKKKTKATDTSFQFIPFYIPYKVYMSDIIDFLDAEPSQSEKIQEILVENNTRIDSILMDQDDGLKYYFKEWGTVQPALARKLSKPDRIYQDVMIMKHPYIKRMIGKIEGME